MSEALEQFITAADRREDGHLTIFKWTTGWKAMLGTPDLDTGHGRNEVWILPMFKSLDEAVKWATNQPT